MLGDRQELDMGEAHVRGVGDQPVGELVLGQEAAVVAALPGAEMDLVDRDRRRGAASAARPEVAVRLVAPVDASAGAATTEAVGGPQLGAEARTDRPSAAAARRPAPMISNL